MDHKKPPTAAQKALHKLGLFTSLDLALHLPYRYEDETVLTPLNKARDGQMVHIEVTVSHLEIQPHPKRQIKLEVRDGTQACTVRFFNAYPSLAKQLTPGSRLRLRGEIKGGMFGWTMMHPSLSSANGELPKTLTPVYASTQALPQSYIRKAVAGGLARAIQMGELEPTLDPELEVPGLMPLKEALIFLHAPSPDTPLLMLEHRMHPAWQRLKSDELLAQQLSQTKARLERARTQAVALKPLSRSSLTPASPQGSKAFDLLSVTGALRKALPFDLTRAQARVALEIEGDLLKTVPMHRLLQGDVGSGKTVVAALAAAQCVDAGWQCALMAPTEILAHQHFEKISDWLQPSLTALGRKVVWLTGSQKKAEKLEALADIESGVAALVIGTHAVIQEQVYFKNLALVIIDEQHRFGVAQRLALRQKSPLMEEALAADRGDQEHQETQENQETQEAQKPRGFEPHLLMMSATPIPRTLAMSYFADLDVSTLDELPPGRTPVLTKLFTESRRAELLLRVKAQLQLGHQVYWVCPLIEESESLDLSNATQTHQELQEVLGHEDSTLWGSGDAAHQQQALDEDSVLLQAQDPAQSLPTPAPVKVGLLHSRMHEQEKKAVMQAFKSGELHVLVSTTVIEVGVDVPNASLMVIEHAERFGLSQLHQLRGRVGRGRAASTCVLLYAVGEHGKLSENALNRLKAMSQTQDGFEIARRDLEIRGPGEFLGARQSGAALMRFADPSKDFFLLEWAQSLAPKLWAQDPETAQAHLDRWQSIHAEYLKA